jgi:hypothetical protein
MKTAIGMLLGLAIVASACGPTPTPDLPKVESKVAAVTRVIPPDAKLETFTVLNAATCLSQTLAEARPKCNAKFVFTSTDPALATLAVGSVMVGAPSLKAASGYLFRVTSITPKGASTEVLATEAAFGDAFEQGEAEFDVKLSPTQLTSATALVPGLKFSNGLPHYQAKLSPQGKNLKPLAVFDFNFDSVIYDDDGNTSSTNDQVRAKGNFYFEIGDGISAGLKWKKVWGVPVYPNGVYFKVAYGIKARASASITVDITKTIEKEIELAKYNFSPITVFVGPVPLVFIPQVIVSINAKGQVTTKATLSANASFDAYGCLEYNDGFNNCSSFGQDFKLGVGGASASMKARATLNVQGNIMLYGVIGPYVKAGAYLELDAVVPRNPVWSLSAGAKASLGLHVDLGIKTLNYDIDIFDKSFGTLATAQNSAPEITLISPNTDLLQNSQKAVCLLSNDLEDGENKINTATVTVTGKGSFNLNKTSCTPLIDWSSEGQQTVTATITDSQGKFSASKTVNFTVINTPPDVFFTAPLEGATVYVDTEFTLLAGWKDGNEALDCNKISWTVAGGTTIQNITPATPSNACGKPSAKVSSVGAHAVTLTVTDSGGKKTSETRTINAIAKPNNFNAPPTGAILSPTTVNPSESIEFFPEFLVVLTAYVKDSDNPSIKVRWLLTNLLNNATVEISSDTINTNGTNAVNMPVRSFRIIDKFTNNCDESYLITLEITDNQVGSDRPVRYTQKIRSNQCIK